MAKLIAETPQPRGKGSLVAGMVAWSFVRVVGQIHAIRALDPVTAPLKAARTILTGGT
jgi:hypothetical protein